MTPHEITEGNKLIAEFMGYHFKEGRYIIKDWDNRKNKGNRLPNICYGGVKFNSSWEWLMLVVEKIAVEHVSFELHIGNVGATSKFERTPNKKNTIKFGHAYHDKGGTILSTWLAVLEFIKWHNQQK